MTTFDQTYKVLSIRIGHIDKLVLDPACAFITIQWNQGLEQEMEVIVELELVAKIV